MTDVNSSRSRSRLVALHGAVNFRDFGGYRAADGRQVKWGQLYRSDSLAELTVADVEILAALGLRTLCDLRHADERAHKPDHVDVVSKLKIHALGFYPTKAQELLAGVRANHFDAADVESHLREAYARFPLDQLAIYSRIMNILLEAASLPFLIHCTSGKDRTGFAAAAILMALGVSRDAILEDYLLTNRYQRDLSFMLGTDIDPAVMIALTQAHPSYLAAAWQTIDQTWGSDQAFVHEGLGLHASAQTRLRALLLEPL
ncbi:MAG: protein tyrosine/serine phosphatase [Nevskia sp.]|nr:protein tyrosine/serine phosphatase [Nevskia sp.]